MNTPAHLIFGMTAFGRPDHRGVTAAALAGGLIPDLSLYLLAGAHLFVIGTDPEVVFGQLYFSDTWQSIFRIDNSIILWSLVLGLGLMLRSPVTIALCGSALLHLIFDFGLHHDDGRAHFWPITDWIFMSPVSYWDPNHHGNIVAPFEIALVLLCCVYLWRRFHGKAMRALILLLGLVQTLPVLLFTLVFSS